MASRQLRLLSPSVATLAPLAGRLVQVILRNGDVLYGRLLAVDAPAAQLQLRLAGRGPSQYVPAATIREVIADRAASY